MAVPVLSVTEMRAWEQASWAAGAREADVIARVGEALAATVRGLTRPGDPVLLLAGRGNNGGDTRAALPHLGDRAVELLAVEDPASDRPALAAALARRPALVVDGLFGIGLNRPLDAAWCDFIGVLNAANARVLAVDLPSGLNADTGGTWGAAVRADVTLTVGAPKSGLLASRAWEWVGRLEVARDVGLVGEPAAAGELSWTLPGDFAGLPPRRSVAAHKGSFGHAVVLAGSLGYAGAAVLAARAAGRARPGLVSVVTMPDSYLPVASQLASAMASIFAPLHPLFTRASAILVGPGLAAPNVPPEVRTEVVRLWREFKGVLVADASALDWLRLGVPCAGPRVITPHPGEAARLLGSTAEDVQGDRPKALRRLAARHEALVVLKGHQTLVGEAKGPIGVNPSGNPGLAQGGTGDVLAGFLCGLLAQKSWSADLRRAVGYAVWEHGAAADRLEHVRRNWTAEDLVTELGM